MIQKRIAVVAVAKIKNKRRVCLVSSRSSRKWILPTGKLEDKLSKAQVAALEAFEEAGLTGKIDRSFSGKIMTRSPNGKSKRNTVIFRMKVKKVFKDWPEKKERKRIWIKPKDLPRRLNDAKLIKLIQKIT